MAIVLMVVKVIMYPFVALLAIGANEILDAGKSVGTAGNQMLLGCLIIALCGIVLYGERQRTKRENKAENRHTDFLKNVEEERKATNLERIGRINMLLEVVRDNTKALSDNAMATRATAEAVDSLKDHIKRK